MEQGVSAVESFLKGGGGGSSTSSPGRWMSYFFLEDGESKVIRFLTDAHELMVANFYEFVLDANGKFQTFVHAPSFYQDDPSWKGEDWIKKFGGKVRVYNSNELAEPTPRRRVVGIAVEREEFPTDVNGRRVLETRDLITDFESRDGKRLAARNFFIVKQISAFWTPVMSYYQEFGTLCDRDYKVTRNGTGRDIVYSVIPKNPDPDWNDDGSSLRELQARYGYGTGKDVDGTALTPESPDRFLYASQTLKEWMENQASEERARAALVGSDGPLLNSSSSSAPSWASSSNDEPTAAPVAASSTPDTSSLRARLERHR